jgi:hypothetical protein
VGSTQSHNGALKIVVSVKFGGYHLASGGSGIAWEETWS